MTLQKKFVINLTSVMTVRKMTPGKLAEKDEIDRGTLSRILTGKNSASINTLSKLAKALNWPASDLLR